MGGCGARGGGGGVLIGGGGLGVGVWRFFVGFGEEGARLCG